MTNEKIDQLIKLLREGVPNSAIRQAMQISDNTIRWWHGRFVKEGHQFPDRPMGRPPLKIPKP